MKKLFGAQKVVIGMIHVAALPGTPHYKGDCISIIEKAQEEALTYTEAGVDAIAIENMHDIPYLRGDVGPEIVAAMATVGYEVRQSTSLPCGIQILAGANREALAVARAAGLDFVRVEGFVFAHVADEGIIEGCAGDLLRFRKQIDGENILVFTDVKKKHSSHALTSDMDIAATARAAEFFLSDGIIVSGGETGAPANPGEVEQVKSAVKIPVLVGSGVTIDNVEGFLKAADGFIIGSHFKKGGHWAEELDESRVKRFVEKLKTLQNC